MFRDTENRLLKEVWSGEVKCVKVLKRYKLWVSHEGTSLVVQWLRL